MRSSDSSLTKRQKSQEVDSSIYEVMHVGKSDQ